MNSLIIGRCALSLCAAATLLVGCGGLQPGAVTQGPAPQGRMPVRHAYGAEKVLHSFGGSSDGAKPESGLTYFKGSLYGTTNIGGVACRGLHTCGTVYSITPSGNETVLHSFTGGLDGARPVARMIVLNGKLYGTTLQGGGGPSGGPCIAKQGVSGGGTVFSITSSGRETVVHAFTRSSDGLFPQAPLLTINGTMYGTTCGGGSGGNGTAFSITPSGYEHVIYSFQYTGGAPPSLGRFADYNGTLYGTASGGGQYGFGTVFSLSTSGRETLLHSFRGGSYNDGADPVSGVNAVVQTLYGTTARGGASGDGTVFSITPTGTETVLHSFSGSDGSGPVASPLNVGTGTLYGTTENGGANGDGTVFSIRTSGYGYTVLYSFRGGQDGAHPLSGVVELNGKLYGTTSAGGAHNSGTVFSLKP